MPRLFTGLEIPSDVAAGLFALRGGLAGARWLDPENYHVTLRFVGDIDNASAREIDQGLSQIGRTSFTVTVDELWAFGGDKPRALVARVQPAPPLLELQQAHERVMRQVGVLPEPRKFTPHVTLARLRASSGAAVADYLATHGLFRTQSFVPSRFVLFSSRAGVGGGPYVVEAAYPLVTEAPSG